MNWQAVYRNFDDEALAALGSSGLLRRAAKDVEAGKVAWAAPPDDKQGLIAADGQQVLFDARGPAFARCDCPAPGTCKHILAAALWLRGQDGAPAAAEARADAPAAAVPIAAPDALAEVLALDPEQLFKAAGRAAVRKAAALYPDLGAAELRQEGGALAIGLPGFDLACRYIAGAGFAGMLSEAPASSKNTLHLLALAAVWRAHGRALPWPAVAEAQPGAAVAVAGLSEDETRMLGQARALLLELCETGWSHVSDMAAPQLRALATSARVESLPLLAGMLRQLAGTCELLARRMDAADEGQALRQAARLYACLEALAHAGAHDAPLPARLRGAHQRSFGEGEALDLFPLGAFWWERRSGARGLTVPFWDLAEGRIVQTVSARRDGSDPNFSRDTAWSGSAPWQGAGAPASFKGRVLHLAQPRLSFDARLAQGGVTRAEEYAPLERGDPRWQQAGHRDWQALGASLQGAAGLLGEPRELVLLRPAGWEPPWLDEVGQQLVWPLVDETDRRLLLRLPLAVWTLDRCANLEAWAASGAAIEGVVARLERQGTGLLEPVSLVVAQGGQLRPVSLDFEAGPARPTLAARLGRLLKSTNAAPPAPPRAAWLRALESLADLLEQKGMSGRLAILDPGARDKLAALRGTMLAVGLDAVADAIAAYLAAPGAGAALILLHLVQTCLDLDTSWLDA